MSNIYRNGHTGEWRNSDTCETIPSCPPTSAPAGKEWNYASGWYLVDKEPSYSSLPARPVKKGLWYYIKLVFKIWFGIVAVGYVISFFLFLIQILFGQKIL